jgi:hypothetical protein
MLNRANRRLRFYAPTAHHTTTIIVNEITKQQQQQQQQRTSSTACSSLQSNNMSSSNPFASRCDTASSTKSGMAVDAGTSAKGLPNIAFFSDFALFDDFDDDEIERCEPRRFGPAIVVDDVMIYGCFLSTTIDIPSGCSVIEELADDERRRRAINSLLIVVFFYNHQTIT